MALSPDTLPTTHLPAAPLAQPVEERVQRSLFGEILDWMLVPLLLLWPISIAITYVVAKTIANQPFDQALDDSVTVLSQQVIEVDGKVATRLNGPARDFLRADDIDNVYYLITIRGNIVEGDRDLHPAGARKTRPLARSARDGSCTAHGGVRIATPTSICAARRGQRHHAAATAAWAQVGRRWKSARLANAIIKGVILPQF